MAYIERLEPKHYRRRSWMARGGLLGVVVLSLMLFSACSSEESSDDTLVLAISTLGTETWAQFKTNSAESAVHDIVGDTLLIANPQTRQPEPGLALSWDLSDDLKTWTFTLRPDIPFHDGYGTVTAEDVKFSWGLMLREDATSGRAGIYRAAVCDDIDNFEIVSELEFKTHACDPQTILPAALHNGGDNLYITSKKYWEEVGEEEATRHPIGTGSYEFVEAQPGVGVKFKRVPNHWNKTGEFENVELRIISDLGARLSAVRSGEVDLAQISTNVLPEAQAANLRTVAIPAVGYSNIFFGGNYPEEYEGQTFPRAKDAPWIQDSAPEKGRMIREALSLAIDRQSIVDDLLLGYGTPGAGPVLAFPGNYAFTNPDWEVPAYDPDRARELLAEGGYPDGFEIDFPIFNQGGRPASPLIAEAIAGMWEKIGIKVNRLPMEQTTLVEVTLARDTSTWVYQYMRGFSDEHAEGYHACCWPDGVFWVYHPAILERTPEMMSEPDYEARQQISQEITEAIMEDIAAIPVVSTDTPYVMGSKIGEWTFIASSNNEIHNVEYMTKA